MRTTLTIPDATECNSLKKRDGCCCTVHFSGGCFKCVMLLHPELNCFVSLSVNSCYILLHMTLLTGYECCLPCCMLGKHHHSQCNKIPVECYIASMPNATKSPVAHCCTRHATDDHLVKLTLYIQFYIQQDPYVDLGCFWQATHSDKCCILLHSAWYPLIDKERLGNYWKRYFAQC